jgi:hypothetical protein
MTDITNIEASRRILDHLHEGRLVQNEWHIVAAKGRDLACLLGAISPDIDDFRKCPASVMPEWLASLTVSMFDGQDRADAMTWAARFGAQMARWHVLDFVAWNRVRAAFCAACVADARRSAAAVAADADAARASAAVDAWAAACASRAAWADASAARAAADAAAAAADAVVVAAVVAAALDWPADAARWAARAAASAAARAAARQAFWARLATALCDLIDAELEAAK